MLVNHFQEFVLECESLDLPLVRVAVSRCFDVFLDAMNFFIGFMIFVKKPGEVIIVHLEMVNGVAVLWEFVEEVVFFDGHAFVVFSC